MIIYCFEYLNFVPIEYHNSLGYYYVTFINENGDKSNRGMSFEDFLKEIEKPNSGRKFHPNGKL